VGELHPGGVALVDIPLHGLAHDGVELGRDLGAQAGGRRRNVVDDLVGEAGVVAAFEGRSPVSSWYITTPSE
jgi:hypothetical protein